VIGFRTLIALEMRKRVDTRAARVGFGILAATVVACGVAGVQLALRASHVGFGEMIVIAGLPVALASAIVGVVVGVGDAGNGGERDGVLAGVSRDRTFWARLAACGLFIAAVVTLAVVVATCCAAAAAILGAEVRDLPGAVPQIGQVAAFSSSSAALGFGIGAMVRSLALGLVSVVLVVLVVDTALAFVGDWTTYVRFGTVQSGLTGAASALPTVTASLLWIVAPITVGWLRARRASL
jgi:hypothetical protein